MVSAAVVAGRQRPVGGVLTCYRVPEAMQNHLVAVSSCNVRDGGVMLKGAQTSSYSFLVGEAYYLFFDLRCLKRVATGELLGRSGSCLWRRCGCQSGSCLRSRCGRWSRGPSGDGAGSGQDCGGSVVGNLAGVRRVPGHLCAQNYVRHHLVTRPCEYRDYDQEDEYLAASSQSHAWSAGAARRQQYLERVAVEAPGRLQHLHLGDDVHVLRVARSNLLPLVVEVHDGGVILLHPGWRH